MGGDDDVPVFLINPFRRGNTETIFVKTYYLNIHIFYSPLQLAPISHPNTYSTRT